jgi:hypothetical protein
VNFTWRFSFHNKPGKRASPASYIKPNPALGRGEPVQKHFPRKHTPTAHQAFVDSAVRKKVLYSSHSFHLIPRAELTNDGPVAGDLQLTVEERETTATSEFGQTLKNSK